MHGKFRAEVSLQISATFLKDYMTIDGLCSHSHGMVSSLITPSQNFISPTISIDIEQLVG